MYAATFNISLRCVQSQSPIARFTSGMYVGHEVSSCGRLARRKSGRLLVVFNCLLVASWKTIMHSAYAQFAVWIGRCCAFHGGANSILTCFCVLACVHRLLCSIELPMALRHVSISWRHGHYALPRRFYNSRTTGIGGMRVQQSYHPRYLS